MTEAEWLAGENPLPMLGFLPGKASDRKFRLFAVACCRRVKPDLTGNAVQAVEAAEIFADGLISDGGLSATWAGIGYPRSFPRRYAAMAARAASGGPGHIGAAHAAASAVNAAVAGSREADLEAVRRAERAAQTMLLRCVFGNPFRPVTPDPRWRTAAVLSLAQQMYDARDFALMPILADALQEAGCDHPDILAHCRSPGPHVRGCWVVDLIQGKS